MTPTEPEKLSDEELKKEVLTQICLIKYGNTPSNLSSEQLAQVAFAASDMYQLITADRKRVALEARIDALQSIKKEDKFGFKRLDLVVEYQDGSNSGFIPYRKHWNDAYDRFIVTVDDAIATLTQQLSELKEEK